MLSPSVMVFWFEHYQEIPLSKNWLKTKKLNFSGLGLIKFKEEDKKGGGSMAFCHTREGAYLIFVPFRHAPTRVRCRSVGRSHIFGFPFCQRLWTVTERPQRRVTFETFDQSDVFVVTIGGRDITSLFNSSTAVLKCSISRRVL